MSIILIYINFDHVDADASGSRRAARKVHSTLRLGKNLLILMMISIRLVVCAQRIPQNAELPLSNFTSNIMRWFNILFYRPDEYLISFSIKKYNNNVHDAVQSCVRGMIIMRASESSSQHNAPI